MARLIWAEPGITARCSSWSRKAGCGTAVGQTSRSVRMGLRPTNSNENPCGAGSQSCAPSLRRASQAGRTGLQQVTVGFRPCAGPPGLALRATGAKGPAWTQDWSPAPPDSISESDAAGKLKRARAARTEDVRRALRGLAEARLVQHFVIKGEVRNVEYIETLSQNRERQSFM